MQQKTPTTRGRALVTAAGQGALAGLAGVAVKTVSEKVEQRLTGRADSYVPGRTLSAMTGRPRTDAEQPVVANHAMHWLTGAVVGSLRGVWAVTGIRGAYADLWHTAVRLAFDQTLENAAGAGAPPASWPRLEQAVDVGHKAVYAIVTGTVADAWIRPSLATERGRRSH